MNIRLEQIFPYSKTTQLSYHVQNFIAITVLVLLWEQNETFVEYKIRWKNVSKMGRIMFFID